MSVKGALVVCFEKVLSKRARSGLKVTLRVRVSGARYYGDGKQSRAEWFPLGLFPLL